MTTHFLHDFSLLIVKHNVVVCAIVCAFHNTIVTRFVWRGVASMLSLHTIRLCASVPMITFDHSPRLESGFWVISLQNRARKAHLLVQSFCARVFGKDVKSEFRGVRPLAAIGT
jgi:hypothetical protein